MHVYLVHDMVPYALLQFMYKHFSECSFLATRK